MFVWAVLVDVWGLEVSGCVLFGDVNECHLFFRDKLLRLHPTITNSASTPSHFPSWTARTLLTTYVGGRFSAGMDLMLLMCSSWVSAEIAFLSFSDSSGLVFIEAEDT